MRSVVALLLVVAVAGVAEADGLNKGDNEVTLDFSYSDTDFGTSGGFDLGSAEDTELSLTYGWLLTDRQELGLIAGYLNEEIEGGDAGPNTESDGTRLGFFYHYNFMNRNTLTPYLGAAVAKLGGDVGDAYDLQYRAEAGVKVYPFDHGGLTVRLVYTELRADAPDLPDADSFGLGVGLLIKY